MIGKQIGNYRVTSEIAHGGMGAVYRGRHQSLPREVVVKSILLSAFPPASRDHLKARFLREAYVQSQLDHPNIVRVYEFFVTDDNYYLVMEFVDGMTMRELISRRGALPPEHVVSLLKQALSALDYAHNFSYVDETGNKLTGIIHRDIKPANLLIDGMGRLKLTDFGIVKLAGESGMTRTGFNPGTAEYMSPEQIRGQVVDARSDIYSLGITFYEALSGKLPFSVADSGSEYGVMRGHTDDAPEPLNKLRPELDPSLVAHIMRSLEKEPSKRFQTAAEWLNQIDRVTEVIAPPRSTQETVQLTEVLEPPTPTAPAPPVVTTNVMPQTEPVRRSPVMVLAVAAIAALLVVGIGGYVLWQQMSTSSPAVTTVIPSPSLNPPPSASPSQSQSQSPSHTVAQIDERLTRAREAEESERYADAIRLYEEYLKTNSDASLTEKVAQLKAFNGHLRIAETWMSQGDYAEARKDFDAALKIRPESKVAKAGLERAQAKLKTK